MIYQALYIPVAGSAIPVVWLHGSLMVATRSLVECLGMNWSAQAKKLEELAGRWQVHTLSIRYRSGRTVTQHCLPAARVTAYLWSLRPIRPDTRRILTTMQNSWDAALRDFLGGPDISEKSASRIWTLQEELKLANERIQALERDLGHTGQQVAALACREMGLRSAALTASTRKQRAERKPVVREPAPYRGADWWLALHRAVDDLGTVTAVAKRLGVSRTAISRTIHEDYPEGSTKAIEIAMRERLTVHFAPGSESAARDGDSEPIGALLPGRSRSN